MILNVLAFLFCLPAFLPHTLDKTYAMIAEKITNGGMDMCTMNCLGNKIPNEQVLCENIDMTSILIARRGMVNETKISGHATLSITLGEKNK
jgi:hypothetical protein